MGGVTSADATFSVSLKSSAARGEGGVAMTMFTSEFFAADFCFQGGKGGNFLSHLLSELLD